MPAQAPHPNAVRLFIEWFLSSAGLHVHEQITDRGFAAPGSGSKLSEIVKGHTFVVRTEEIILKAGELGLDDKFSKIVTGN